jgi:RluA family pseudouridine synthase
VLVPYDSSDLRTIYAVRIDDDLSGQSVRAVLTRMASVSQSILRRAKRLKGVRVNGDEARVSTIVKTGDLVELLDVCRHDRAIAPEPVHLSIVYEDARLVVVDKPAGMLVHPVKRHRSGTIANGLAWLYLVRGEKSGIHPIHRLDRGTSGLVLIAKDSLTHSQIARQLLERRLKRVYIALVEGVLPEDSGVLDAPLEVVPGSFIERRTAADEATGLPARTRYEVVERMPGRTLLRISLDTGRTHQIRVHLSSAGYPLVGDTLYGSSSEDIMRQALHACEVSFVHPGHPDGFAQPCLGRHCECATSRRMTLCSQLPADFQSVVGASRE